MSEFNDFAHVPDGMNTLQHNEIMLMLAYLYLADSSLEGVTNSELLTYTRFSVDFKTGKTDLEDAVRIHSAYNMN